MVLVAREMTDTTRLIEFDDRWSVAVPDADITRVSFDWAVTLAVGVDTERVEIRIEGPFVVTTPDGADTQVLPEGDPTQLGPALTFVRTTVAQIDAAKSGHLVIELIDGTRLRVPGSDAYEPWQIAGPRGLKIVSTPDHSVSVWQPGLLG
jgi:hypothetical protein